jgi:regulatory protein
MRGHNPAAVDAVLDRFGDRGLLDDGEYAKHFARVRSGKGHGPGRLISDLLGKGVEKRIAEEAVRETLEAEGVDPLAQARTLAEKRALQLGDLPPDAKRRRLTAYLGRRGYQGYEVGEIVSDALRTAVGNDE